MKEGVGDEAPEVGIVQCVHQGAESDTSAQPESEAGSQPLHRKLVALGIQNLANKHHKTLIENIRSLFCKVIVSSIRVSWAGYACSLARVPSSQRLAVEEAKASPGCLWSPESGQVSSRSWAGLPWPPGRGLHLLGRIYLPGPGTLLPGWQSPSFVSVLASLYTLNISHSRNFWLIYPFLLMFVCEISLALVSELESL